MSILSPSGMETADYRAAGCNAIFNSNTTKLNTYLGKMMTATDAEITIESANDDSSPVFHIKDKSGTKLFEVLANGTIYPTLGTIPELVHGASQGEATYTDIDDIKNKLFIEYMPIVELTSGSHTLDISSVQTEFTIKGDTRELVGLSYITGTTIKSSDSVAGSGTVSLTSSANDITVTGSTTSPDFDSLLATGDKVIITDTSGSAAEYEVSSTNNNVITLTTAAPTVNGEGAAITIMPNVVVTTALTIPRNYKVTFVGIKFTSKMICYGEVIFGHCCFDNIADYACTINNGKATFSGYENSFTRNNYGLFVTFNGHSVGSISVNKATYAGIEAHYSSSISCGYSYITFAAIGIAGVRNTSIFCDYSYITKISGDGYAVWDSSFMECTYCTSRYCNVGFSANWYCRQSAWNCAGLCSGNSRDTYSNNARQEWSY